MKIDAKAVREMYETYIIPLTRDVEVCFCLFFLLIATHWL